jgi:hypothetical protein
MVDKNQQDCQTPYSVQDRNVSFCFLHMALHLLAVRSPGAQMLIAGVFFISDSDEIFDVALTRSN